LPLHVASSGTTLPPFGTLGVGHNEDPVPKVRGTNGFSRKAVPLCVIPACGQVSENSCKSSRKQSWDVFHDHVSGSKYANDSDVFRPQPGTISFDSDSPSGV